MEIQLSVSDSVMIVISDAKLLERSGDTPHSSSLAEFRYGIQGFGYVWIVWIFMMFMFVLLPHCILFCFRYGDPGDLQETSVARCGQGRVGEVTTATETW